MGNHHSLSSDRYFIFAGQIYERQSPQAPLALTLAFSSLVGLSAALVGYSGWQLLAASASDRKRSQANVAKQGKSLLTIHAIEHSVDENEKLKSQLKQLTAALNTNTLLGPSPSRRAGKQEPIAEQWDENFSIFEPYNHSKTYESMYSLFMRLEAVFRGIPNQSTVILQKCLDSIRSSCLEINQSFQSVVDINSQRSGESGPVRQYSPRRRRQSSLATKRSLAQSIGSFRDGYLELDSLWTKEMEVGAPDSQTGRGLCQQWRNSIVQYEMYVALLRICIECHQSRGALTLLRSQDSDEAVIRKLLADVNAIESEATKSLMETDWSKQSQEACLSQFNSFVKLLINSSKEGLDAVESLVQCTDGEQRGDLPLLELKSSFRIFKVLAGVLVIGLSIRQLQDTSLTLAKSISRATGENIMMKAKSIHLGATNVALHVFANSEVTDSDVGRDEKHEDWCEQLVQVNRAVRAMLQTTHLSRAQEFHRALWCNLSDSLSCSIVSIVQFREENLGKESVMERELVVPGLVLQLAMLCRQWCAETNPASLPMKAALVDVMIDPFKVGAVSTGSAAMAESVTLAAGDRCDEPAADALSCVNLLLESDLDHASGLVYPRSAELLMNDPVHAVTVVRDHVTSLLTEAIPNASVGVSVCRGPQGEVAASTSGSPRPVDNDVIVCFSLDSGDVSDKQFVFIQRTLGMETRAQVFGLLDKLDLVKGWNEAKGDEEKGPEMQNNLKELQEQGRIAVFDVTVTGARELILSANTNGGKRTITHEGESLAVHVRETKHFDFPDVLSKEFQESETMQAYVVHLPLVDKLICFTSTPLVPLVTKVLNKGLFLH